MFLATFRTITTPDILFELLVERFQMSPPKNLSPADVGDWKLRYLLPTRKRVLDLFVAWLEQHQLLEEEPHIARHLTDFLLSSVTPVLPEEASNILQKIEQLVLVFLIIINHNKLTQTCDRHFRYLMVLHFLFLLVNLANPRRTRTIC